MKTVKIILEQDKNKTDNRFSLVPGNEERGKTILKAGSPLILHLHVNTVLESIKDNGTACFSSSHYKKDGDYMMYDAEADFEELTKHLS